MTKQDVALREAPVAPVETANETSALLSMIERVAMNPEADLDKMERLLEMRERMETRAAKQAYLDAFARLQEELPAVTKKGTGHNIKYARFEDLIGTIKPFLAKHGFSLSFRTAQAEKTITVTCVLGHAAGHTEQTDIVLPADTSGSKNAVQAWGSSTSYGKRYAAMTLLGIATQDEDDDGGTIDTLTDAQIAQIEKLIKDTGANREAFLGMGGFEDVSDIPQSQFKAACDKLKMFGRQVKK
jgi:hypothetical protein